MRSFFVVLIEAEILAVQNMINFLTVNFEAGDEMASPEHGQSSDFNKWHNKDSSGHQEAQAEDMYTADHVAKDDVITGKNFGHWENINSSACMGATEALYTFPKSYLSWL